jgi:hypothetical protein
MVVTGVLGVVAIGLALWWANRSNETRQPAKPSPVEVSTSDVRTNGERRVTAPSATGLTGQLARTAADLHLPRDAASARQQLAELRRSLTSTSPQEASLAICEFLDAGTDAGTGVDLCLGAGSKLLDSPSLRVFLLDLLAELDPAAAAAYSKRILSELSSPDEWAIALRNIARGESNPAASELLALKLGEMLRNESWVSNPSTGFLEAFDVAVHLGEMDLVPTLTFLLQQTNNQAVVHASFLALDRMVISQPAEMFTELLEHRAALEGRELTRAGYFARANVGDPAQRTLLESYLLDSGIGPEELNAFVGLYPNANYMISHNLITENATPDGASLRLRDQAALRVTEEWLTDPRFQALRPELARIKQRLENFAQSDNRTVVHESTR